jgi:hypothetical protein
MSAPYEIGVYYFPNYHIDPQNEAIHGPRWTEWELVKTAQPRFPSHRQPLIPAWGYEDEADPLVFERKIDAANQHGINHFIFDWYWYDNGPFLNRCLDEGYMRAKNLGDLQFALMWANHDWLNIHPARLHTPPPILASSVRPEAFDAVTDYIIEHYFCHPQYWKIDGCPYFSFYELNKLIDTFGGTKAAAAALDRFRRKTQEAGFPDLHLNAVVWGLQLLPGEKMLLNPQQMVQELGVQSVTSYVWIHHVKLPMFPETPYEYVHKEMIAYWNQAATAFGVPYYPNVTMGWDSSPRTDPLEPFTEAGYPFIPILGGNTPEAFKAALESVKAFLDAQGNNAPKIFNINAWNEWTEGSYLEPDTVHGMAYLEAIQQVFASTNAGITSKH